MPGSGRLPDFIVIGAMKCGTSGLYRQLAQRSGLFLSTPKEPCFFSDDPVFARGNEWYASLFEAARPNQICGEASTHYTKLPNYPKTVERMRALLPEVRLIYVMRDPIYRIISQYIHEWTLREVRGSLIECVEQHERFIAYSCYASQIEPYRATFGENSVCPVFFEHLLAHPDEEFARICRFLGDPSPEPPRWEHALGGRNVSSQRLRESRWRERVLRFPGARQLKDRLSPALRDRITSLWQMRERPELPPDCQRRLEETLDADLERLGNWLGRPLSCRGWREQVMAGPPTWQAIPRAVSAQ